MTTTECQSSKPTSRSQLANRGLRELRGLQSSVNYDSKLSESSRNTKGRVMMLSL